MTHAPVIQEAARAIADYVDFRHAKRRRSRQRDSGEKHTGDTHKRYPGKTCADVLDAYTDDPQLWCKLASAAYQAYENGGGS